MWATSRIRRHIFRLPLGQLFTTREFLGYGTRAAVDQALYRLVKCGVINRLARGVFVKEGSRHQAPTVLEVAIAKAKAFGKQIATYGAEVASKLGLAAEPGLTHVFCVSASSSSFRYGGTTIHFKKTGPRKMQLGDDRAGKTLRALWDLGRLGLTPTALVVARSSCGRREHQQMLKSAPLLPWWLSLHILR